MSNDYFRFRQFIIHQQKSAMKVTTDACILGAYGNLPATGTILDIGCGTGLLSLMMAQRTACLIDAIEPHEASFTEAGKNILSSKWKGRISIYQKTVQEFFPDKTYDLIICNPPFFENHLRPKRAAATISKHNLNLNHDDLLRASKRLLAENGSLNIILPFAQSGIFLKKSHDAGLFEKHQLFITNFEGEEPHRVIFFLQKKPSIYVETARLTIFREPNSYTEEFTRLLKPFYLHL